MNRIYNFSAGPATLPIDVLNQVQEELLDWNGLGLSVMEISHRSEEFLEMACASEIDLRDLLNVPSNYKILFCQGGARTQFAAVPMNLLLSSFDIKRKADYIISGYWSKKAAEEARKYCLPCLIDVSFNTYDGFRGIKSESNWELSSDSNYVHYCPNETIDGISIDSIPDWSNIIVVADCSSMLLSSPLNINSFGIIYAGAQKNIGLSGLTIVIIREDLLSFSCEYVPSTLSYKILAENFSMFNTPPTFSWYLSGLLFKWLKKQGGLLAMDKINKKKANLLYTTIDNNDFYINNVLSINRSLMNVTFNLMNSKLDKLFLKEACASGLYGLKGHRFFGGMRASLYNAMPLKGVQMLVDFMLWFANRYG